MCTPNYRTDLSLPSAARVSSRNARIACHRRRSYASDAKRDKPYIPITYSVDRNIPPETVLSAESSLATHRGRCDEGDASRVAHLALNLASEIWASDCRARGGASLCLFAYQTRHLAVHSPSPPTSAHKLAIHATLMYTTPPLVSMADVVLVRVNSSTHPTLDLHGLGFEQSGVCTSD